MKNVKTKKIKYKVGKIDTKIILTSCIIKIYKQSSNPKNSYEKNK